MSLSQRIPYSTTAGSDRQLHAAIEDGDHCRVTRLLRNGASVNCYVDGLTPVARAIIHKETSIAQELLNQRPDVHQGKRLYPRGTNTEIPVSATEKQGLHQPLLILAIINGLPDIADHLLKLGADINSTGKHTLFAIQPMMVQHQNTSIYFGSISATRSLMLVSVLRQIS